MVEGENRSNDRVHFMIMEVDTTLRGANHSVSYCTRVHDPRLFRQEVPEIEQGLAGELNLAPRDAGSRALNRSAVRQTG
jgi:N utilization substance protein A